MLPFHEALRLWRRYRRLTQAALAERARIARPNLSAIERGRREVSLGTLRALALGLELRPGVLADGLPPRAPEGGGSLLSRRALERIADAVVEGTSLNNEQERALGDALRKVVRHRLCAASPRHPRVRRGVRAAEDAWLWLRAATPPAAVRNLLQRIAKRQYPDG
jgi:transcriptional regulator with XRE-family HTH domain